MKIKRFNVLSYVLSEECEKRAEAELEQKKIALSKKYSAGITYITRRIYMPLLKVSADMVPWYGKASGVVHTNYFFLGLNDGNLYYLHTKRIGERISSAVHSEDFKWPLLDTFSLQSLVKLSPNAMSTLGYLLKVKKTRYDGLDATSKKAAEELAGQGYAAIYLPGEDEPLLKSLAQGIVDMAFNVHRSAYYVRPSFSLPSSQSNVYNLSAHLLESDVFDSGYDILKVNHTPDKLGYILSLLFNGMVAFHEVVYLPIIECIYHHMGKEEFDFRFVSALRGIHHSKKYANPYRLEPLMLGTVGYRLNSIPAESASIKFSDVAGMEDVKETLSKAIIYPLLHPELSREFSHKIGGGVMFYGPPGCGKTYIMRAVVGEAGVNLYTVDIPDIIGQTPEAGSERLHDLFNEARANSPSILFIDEIDALGGRRTMQSSSSRFIVNQLLADMGGIEQSNENVLIVGATNTPWDVDPALRRAGRFTTKVFIPPPGLQVEGGFV